MKYVRGVTVSGDVTPRAYMNHLTSTERRADRMEPITLRKGNHVVTTTVPIEAVNLEARGYARETGDKPQKQGTQSRQKTTDKKN